MTGSGRRLAHPGARLGRRDRAVDAADPAGDRPTSSTAGWCCAERPRSATRCTPPPRSWRCARTRPKPGRAATGLAVLRVRTTDQQDRRVLDFWRCAMLPLSDPDGRDAITPTRSTRSRPSSIRRRSARRSRAGGWTVSAAALRRRETPAPGMPPGTVWRLLGGDVVSAAPELARMTLNVPRSPITTPATPAGGWSTAGTRSGSRPRTSAGCSPNLVTFVAWHGCDHTGPVLEGDTLSSDDRARARATAAGDHGGSSSTCAAACRRPDGDPAETVGRCSTGARSG